MNKVGTPAGQMRLQREARASKKDIDQQIKKKGKLTDNFICLPDPDNVYEWYYIIFGLEMEGFRGGFYLGKVKCPDTYPAKAPGITLQIENGRFHTTDSICMSISDLHPESWNPVWKVSQMVIGLLSFWLGDAEGTYGEMYDYNYSKEMSFVDHKIRMAKASRKQVLEHPMFKKIFEPYAAAIGIDKEIRDADIEGWAEHTLMIEQLELAKKSEDDDQAKMEEEEKAAAEEEARLQAEKEAAEAEELARVEAEKQAEPQKTKEEKQFEKIKKLGFSGFFYFLNEQLAKKNQNKVEAQ